MRKHFVMRALGWLYTPVAALLWLLTIIATLIAFLPAAFTTPMPLVPGYSGTVHQFFVSYAQPFTVLLLILNGLSGRWGPNALRGLDLNSSRLGWWGMVGITLMIFGLLAFWQGYAITAADFWLFVTLLAVAFFDLKVYQGEQWRASSMKTADLEAATIAVEKAKAAGQPVPAMGAPGPLAQFVPMSLTRLELPNEKVIIEVDKQGGFDFDLPDLTLPRLLGLAAQKVMAPAPAVP